jgi:nitrogen regulatory protein P-II 1
MQLITAIVRPSKVSQVCGALQQFGFQGLTVTEASGFGKRRGPTEIYRGTEYSPGLTHEMKVEIVARDEDVRDMIDVICQVAATGALGDGKIWVSPIDAVVRIRTREAGIEAL